jgi:hypothetical protein
MAPLLRVPTTLNIGNINPTLLLWADSKMSLDRTLGSAIITHDHARPCTDGRNVLELDDRCRVATRFAAEELTIVFRFHLHTGRFAVKYFMQVRCEG